MTKEQERKIWLDGVETGKITREKEILELLTKWWYRFNKLKAYSPREEKAKMLKQIKEKK